MVTVVSLSPAHRVETVTKRQKQTWKETIRDQRQRQTDNSASTSQSSTPHIPQLSVALEHFFFLLLLADLHRPRTPLIFRFNRCIREGTTDTLMDGRNKNDKITSSTPPRLTPPGLPAFPSPRLLPATTPNLPASVPPHGKQLY